MKNDIISPNIESRRQHSAEPRQKISSSIHAHLLFLLAAVLVPILLVQMFIFYSRFRTWRVRAHQSTLEIARAASASFDGFFRDVLKMEKIIGLAFNLPADVSDDQTQRILVAHKEENSAIHSLSWANIQGQVVASSDPNLLGKNIGDQICLQKLMSNEECFLSNLFVSLTANQPIFTISGAVRNENDELSGIVTAAVIPDELEGLLALNQEGVEITVIDREGRTVYSKHHARWAGESRDVTKDYPGIEEALRGKEITASVLDMNKKVNLFALSPIGDSGWVVAASRPEKEAMAPVISNLFYHGGLFLLVTISAFFLSLVISRKVTLPIKKLRNHALALGQWPSNSRIEIEEPSELKELAKAFNIMAQEISGREQRLQQEISRTRKLATELEATFSCLTNPVIVFDSRAIPVKANPAAIAAYGFDPVREDYPDLLCQLKLRQPGGKMVGAEELASARAVKGETIVDERFFYTDPQGHEYIVLASASPLILDGEISGAVLIWHDISKREKLIQQVEEYARELANANDQLRVSTAELMEQKKALQKAHDSLEMRVRERTFDLEKTLEVLRIEINEREQAEKALRESENRLRLLSSQLLTIQENERKWVGRELHDGIGQKLTAIKFLVENNLHHKRKGKGKARTKTKQMEAIIPLVQEGIDEVRRIQANLRPAILDDLGIVPTIEWFTREFQKVYTHINIEKEITLQEMEIPVPLKTVVYRVMQEAFNNIAKYSEAQGVRLLLGKTDNGVELTIEDNGQGFDLTEVTSGMDGRRGFGLSGMKERTELSGGVFTIHSNIGKGTTVRALWPIGAESSPGF